MSYKFQRLREKVRAAIVSGELSGKLPGERALAERFHVNAKTLSKALTDLAAEGLLDRSIGRGTYVKGSLPQGASQGRWLVIAGPTEIDSPLVQALRSANPDLQVVSGVSDVRPSFINQFAAVVDFAADTSDHFLRDLVVRNIPVVAVNREPTTYSMHCVAVDVALGVQRVGRDLALAGHQRFAVVEPRGCMHVGAVLRQTVARYAFDTSVDPCTAEETPLFIQSGATAVVCTSSADVRRVKAILNQKGASIPGHVSLAAIGVLDDQPPCTGYFCSARQLADAVVGLLRDNTPARPATLWLAGAWHDVGTTSPMPSSSVGDAARIRMGSVVA